MRTVLSSGARVVVGLGIVIDQQEARVWELQKRKRKYGLVSVHRPVDWIVEVFGRNGVCEP